LVIVIPENGLFNYATKKEVNFFKSIISNLENDGKL